jgi:tryptophanyl-tRNA synthetase
MNEVQKPVILSGMQSTGNLTIGHLTGALSNWVKMQEEFECYYMIADLHALTVRNEPKKLRESILNAAAMYIAAGIDPDKSALFIQSHVPAHSQLTWVLNCYTGMGECSRMTQFKDKSEKNPENINVGLFSYPVLMASDILLYQADRVPVGDDQKQHLELTRNLAQRFNHYYSDTFKIPEPYIPKVGARIMSLQEPTKKMSKSDENHKSTIFLTDDDNEIKNKIKRAVTDSDNSVKFSDKKPGVSNLITLYHIATGKSISDIEQEFDGKGYGDFKMTVADAVADYIKPIREKYLQIRSDKKYLAEVLTKGAEKANQKAFKTLRKVYKKIGLISINDLNK